MTAASRAPGGAQLDDLLSRRLLFVAGKGGTGKSTLTAALALIAARAGKRVLCIEVDAKGDLAHCLGSDEVGFEPRVVQPNVSALTMHPEESLQEYLRVYFKVPRLARLTPLARVFDFIATGVPGTKDMLIVGKIAFEERRRDKEGRPVWDLIIVDSSASGHVLPQIGAARAMLGVLKGGGVIRAQVAWIDAILADHRRTQLLICALPEEMPVEEAIELHDQAGDRTHIGLGPCFLNRTFPIAIGAREQRAVARWAEDPGHPAGAGAFLDGINLGVRLHAQSVTHARRLRRALSVPVIELPYSTAHAGLATTRAVTVSIETGCR